MSCSSAEKHRKILIAGDTNRSAVSCTYTDLELKHCDNILDAIESAAQNQYDTVFVVMSGIRQQGSSAIASLKRAGKGAKIILLAQMHEETSARDMTRCSVGKDRMADDYYICPVDIGNILNGAACEKPDGLGQPSRDKKTAELLEKIRQLENLATEDDLTGLKNRRYFYEFLHQIITRAKKTAMQVTLLVFDIDDFKHYNDTYGHGVGDNVLRQAAAMMKRCCRTHDVVGRIGGDEFAVIFWDCSGYQNQTEAQHKSESENERRTKTGHPRQAFFMAERFRRQLESTKFSFLGPEGKGSLTISGGLASFPFDGTTAESLVEQADGAMLHAKKSGKNRIYLVGRP